MFVDTSAFLALLDQNDANHIAARRSFKILAGEQTEFVTSNYVLIETCALLQNRLGLESVRDLHNGLLPLIEIVWMTEITHRAATLRLFAARRRKLSLVDCCSFELMRELNIANAFAFDRHFADEGFELV